jgi:hypothetical protein
MRPLFLDQPYFSQRAPRMDQSRADYGCAVTRYKHERSWLLSDICIAVIFVALLAALAVGVFA